MSQEFQKKIGARNKLLFLYLTSVLGFFFSLVYILFERIETVIGFIPILIVGMVIPIYIGYIRGAILVDSIEERIRGWIYFIYGLIVYIAEAVPSIVRRLLIAMNIEFENISLLAILAGGLILGFVIGRGRMHRWFSRIIFTAFDRKATTLTDKIYKDTALSAFILSFFMYISFSTIFSAEFVLSTVGIVTLPAATGIALFAWSERDIRKWSSLTEFSEYVKFKRERVKPYLPSKVGYVLFPISLVLLAFSIISLDLENIFVTLVTLVVGAIGCMLYPFSVERTKISVEKKKRRMSKEIETRLTQLLERL